jgi:hypothetical protein
VHAQKGRLEPADCLLDSAFVAGQNVEEKAIVGVDHLIQAAEIIVVIGPVYRAAEIIVGARASARSIWQREIIEKLLRLGGVILFVGMMFPGNGCRLNRPLPAAAIVAGS